MASRSSIRETVTHWRDGIRHIDVTTEWVLRREGDRVVGREPVTAAQPRITLHIGMETAELNLTAARAIAAALEEAANDIEEATEEQTK